MEEPSTLNIPDRTEERLRPMRLRPELEPLARELFDKAHCGSREIWPELSKDRLSEDTDFRQKFYGLAHDGMFAAQMQMVERIQAGAELNNSEEVLFRGIADSIAWQMINGQLCYARRIYREQRQPNFNESSFETVVSAAKFMRERDPGSMPLISDITSFVQIGDLLVASPGKGISTVEVKTGKENERIGKLLDFYQRSGCEQFREILTQTETKHTVKQFERMRRQVSRMGFFGTLVNSGEGEDPDTGQKIAIPEPTVVIDTWDEALLDLIEQAEKKGWAYGVQGSIFIGCYRGDNWLRAGHIAFLGALAGVGNIEEQFHVARLADCMSIPLAPPLFTRELAEETIFDLLFGRMHICIGLNVPQMIEDCEMTGMNARIATRKEMASARQVGGNPVLLDGKGVFIEHGGKGMLVLDGIILRAMFHGQRPESIIRGFIEND